MGVFRVQVHYKLGTTGKWSNVWHVNATGIAEAAAGFESIGVPALLPWIHVAALLDSLLVSDPASDDFITVPVSESGTNGDIGELLPLFNSVKLIFPTPGFGRPDLKYMKGLLTEGMQANGTITAAVLTALDTAFTAFIADMAAGGVALVSHEGDEYSDVTAQGPVQMRQMHRKRRKTVPTP